MTINAFEVLTHPGTDDALPLPESGPYYIAAKQGLFIHKNTLLGRVLCPVKEWPEMLAPMAAPQDRGYYWFTADRIPTAVVSRALAWFRHIFAKQSTEAAVILIVNPETMEWDILVPDQKVTMASVHFDYKATEIPDGWNVIGSIHSHCDFSAHHSGTDSHDATTGPGVHLTFGHVDRDEPSTDAFISAHGLEFHFETDSVAEDFTPLTEPLDPKWDEHVIEETWHLPAAKALSTFPKHEWKKADHVSWVPTPGNRYNNYDDYGQDEDTTGADLLDMVYDASIADDKLDIDVAYVRTAIRKIEEYRDDFASLGISFSWFVE